MGLCQSKSSDAVAPEIREVKLVVFGLDNSGKSTLLANLNADSTDGITPTIGFSSIKLNMDDTTVTLYDVGGGPRIRGIWSNYFSEAYGVIYVVDSSAPNRLNESANALRGVMNHDRVKGKPLLVFANKQDLDNACTEVQVSTALGIGDIVPNEKFQTMKCTALKRAVTSKSDPALRRGLSWLLGKVMDSYDELEERVKRDVSVQREREAAERRERMERVRRMREEREKAQTEGSESVDTGEPVNPFKPISVVVVEVAEREAAGRHPTTEAHSTPGQFTGGTVREEGAPDQRRDSESTISQTSSNLSDTDSLTEVTQPSGGSSESLQAIPSFPLDPPPLAETTRSGSPTVLKRTRLDPIKTKKERKQMLITRLKNRNKTAPAPSPTLPDSPGTCAPVASRDTWTGTDLEPVPLSEDPLEGLPPLPTSRRVLPALSVGGNGQRAFHLEEELEFVPSSAVVQVSHPPKVLT